VVLIGLLVLVLIGGAWPFLIALLLVTLLATHEFYTMAQAGGYQPAYAVGMAAAFALIANAAYAAGYEEIILLATLLLAIVWQLWTLAPASPLAGTAGDSVASTPLPSRKGGGPGITLSSDQLRQSWFNIAFTLGGVLYIPWLLRLGWLVYNYCRPDQPCASAGFGLGGIGPGIWWVVLVLVATTFADTGAYFVGSRFGRRKLIPWISPAKTVEGLLGGVFFTIIGVLLLTPVLGIAWYNALLLGPLLALAAVCGDLIESMFKRAMKVKDSGNLIPGHGGILDRIDSVILTVAVVFFYITYAQFLFAT
jgi:phosphatidate cytidylyltransferase